MSNTSSTGSEPLSSRLFWRIAGQQEDRLHAELFSALRSPSLAGKAALCGSAALHGIYLRSRRAPCLDFKVPPLLAIRFPGLLEAAGVAVEPSPIRNRYDLTSNQAALPGIRASLHLHPTQQMPDTVETEPFHDPAGRQTPVATLSLIDVALEKLDVLTLRRQPVDYLDAWCLWSARRDVGELVADRLRCQFPDRFDAARALHHLHGVTEARWRALSPLIFPLPPLEQVRRELGEWWRPLTRARKGGSL